MFIILYSYCSLSFCTFLKKVPKTWAVVYGIRCFLCSRVALRHLSVGSHLATRCLSQCLGWQELAALKHHATCFQALLGCSLCLPTLPFRPWRGITFAKKIHWHTSWTLTRTMVMSSKTGTVKGHNLNPGDFWNKWEDNSCQRAGGNLFTRTASAAEFAGSECSPAS